jgi:hypothetical protein
MGQIQGQAWRRRRLKLGNSEVQFFVVIQLHGQVMVLDSTAT